jgi:hypothetical protein
MPSIIPIPAFRDNYIWVIRDGAHAAIVDPGDAAPLFACLDAEGLELTAIINTRHHSDHVGGNEALLVRWPVPVLGPAREKIPGRKQSLSEGDRVDEKRDRGMPTLPSTIADERATNPFLRAADPPVKAAAEAHAKHRLSDAVASFAELRAWKNGFS